MRLPRRSSPLVLSLSAISFIGSSIFWNPLDLIPSSSISLSSSSSLQFPVLQSFASRLKRPDDGHERTADRQVVLTAPISTSWRDQLEEDTEYTIGESRTLGFDRIVTLTLPGNEASRGVHMNLLAKSLELDIDSLPATPSSSLIVAWIAERVLADYTFRAKHASSSDESDPSYLYTTPSPAYLDKPWPAYLETYDPVLEPERFVRTGEFGTEDEVWEKLVKAIGIMAELDAFTVSGVKGMIACWHAHVRALLWVEQSEEVKEGGGVLILEDDVDMEWDVKRLWGGMSLQLPVDWDIVYFGYVWSQENPPAGLAPTAIRRSSGPLGGMAYAVSKAGASQILAQLRKGSVYDDGDLRGVGPFGQPWDNAMRALISMSHITSYSVSPPLVVHPGLFSSNIGVGGSNWNGTLLDSTITRVCRHYGIKGEEMGGCFEGWNGWIAGEGGELVMGAGGV